MISVVEAAKETGRHLILSADAKVQGYFRERQRELLPPSIVERAERALGTDVYKKLLKRLDIPTALRKAEHFRDADFMAAIAYVQGFPIGHAIQLVERTAYLALTSPSISQISTGRRLSGREMRSAGAYAKQLLEKLDQDTVNEPHLKQTIGKSIRLLSWQRRYNHTLGRVARLAAA